MPQPHRPPVREADPRVPRRPPGEKSRLDGEQVVGVGAAELRIGLSERFVVRHA